MPCLKPSVDTADLQARKRAQLSWAAEAFAKAKAAGTVRTVKPKVQLPQT